jgi:hypothetical protein
MLAEPLLAGEVCHSHVNTRLSAHVMRILLDKSSISECGSFQANDVDGIRSDRSFDIVCASRLAGLR